MIQELTRVVLKEDLPEYNLTKGDIGVVVYVYNNGEDYEVEFMTVDGETIAVVTLAADQIRRADPKEMPNARPISVS